jgi:hypothetical protein
MVNQADWLTGKMPMTKRPRPACGLSIYQSTTRAYTAVAGDFFENSFCFRDYGDIVAYAFK